MYTYDEQSKKRKSRQKAMVGYVATNVLAILLLIMSICIYCGLLKQGINLVSQVRDILANQIWTISLSFIITTAVWFGLGNICNLFEYRYTYAMLGAAALDVVLLLHINNKACETFLSVLGKIGTVFTYIIKHPFLLIIAIIVLIVVILKLFLKAIIDIVFEIIEMLSWYELRDSLPRMLVYFVIFHFFILGLSILDNSLLFLVGITLLVYGMYLLWSLKITKYHVAKEEVIIKGRKKNSNIVLRILKDVVIGMAITIIIYYSASLLYFHVLKQWFSLSNITITEFNVQEIFFTELSLVFLVISFVTLLANKTETVYWVDVIQYRLVKPNHTSIVDISSYIFANLILSLIAFVFPALSNMMIISFIITIILLGFLSFKLLISFFGVEHLKEELKKEYRMALEYRKLVCVLQEETKSRLQFEVIKGKNQYEQEDLGEFGSRLQKDTNELQDIHDRLLTNEEGYGLRSKRSYRKLLYYAKRFDYKVYQYEIMRDGLYSNILRCINEIRIKEIGEQILFLLRYKEYEYAHDCIRKTLEQCPIAFLDMFDESLDEIPKDEDLICFLYQVVVELSENPENARLIKSEKYKNAVKRLTAWADEFLEEEKKKMLLSCQEDNKVSEAAESNE